MDSDWHYYSIGFHDIDRNGQGIQLYCTKLHIVFTPCSQVYARMTPGKTPDFTLRLLELFSDLLGQSIAETKKATRSRIFFIFCLSTFGMFVITFFFQESLNFACFVFYCFIFVQSMVLAVMVAVPYDSPINTAADVLMKSKMVTV